MKILFGVSSVGLGHASRSRVISKILKKELSKAGIEFIAGEPALSYLKYWRENLHYTSSMLESLSNLVEKAYKNGKLIFNTRLILEEYNIIKKNAQIFEENIDIDDYDLVIGDEFWELVASKFLNLRSPPKILITDFISYPYKLKNLVPALLVNRYIKSRVPLFDKKVFVGLSVPHQRWFFIWGESMTEWFYKNFEIIGPIPTFTKEEEPSRERERKRLGIGDEKLIVFSLGGTRAGLHLIRLAILSYNILKEELGKIKMLMVPGPRSNIRSLTSNDIIIINNNYRLYQILAAADCAVTLGGLATITELLTLGVPGIIFPLEDHYEQEENAEMLRKLSDNYIIGKLNSISPRILAKNIKFIINKRVKPRKQLHKNPYKIIRLLKPFLKNF